MGATLLPDELVVNEARAFNTIVDWMSHWADTGNTSAMTYYGKTPVQFQRSRVSMSEFRTKEHLEDFITWARKAHAHTSYIIANPELFAPLFTSDVHQVTVRHASIQTTWSRDGVDWLTFKPEAITRVLQGIVERTNDSSRASMLWTFKNPKLSNNYLDDASAPLILRSAWLARRTSLMATSGRYNELRIISLERPSDGVVVEELGLVAEYSSNIPLSQWYVLDRIIKAYNTQPSAPLLLSMRKDVLERQALLAGTSERVNRHLQEAKFSAFWSKMKETQRSARPSLAVAQEQWDTIPLQPAGTTASRTWGIEVEVVNSDRTSRPVGWRDVHDGSLPDTDCSCECDCDNCYDGDHCEDSGDHCYYGCSGESREFVSPILQDFNSNGLRQICNDLPDDDGWTEPGIHVHVGARDLTVADISRLLFAYAAIAPIIKPIYYRQVFGYCEEMSFGNVQWWTRTVKEQMRLRPDDVAAPYMLCEGQPDSRYVDVNLLALSKHGTIEFRSMGPRYNYDHLIRWAWFCREMVNISRLDIDQRVWLSCRSVADVIGVLRKYGTEMPSTVEFDNINSRDLELVEQ